MPNITDIAENIKEQYLPIFDNQLGIETSPFLAKITKKPLEGEKIVAAAPVGIAGGFGFGAEGESTPKAGHQNYERFVINPADMYNNINISVKTVKLAGGGSQSFVNTLDAEVRAAYAASQWNLGCALFGNGTGKRAKVKAASSGATTVEVDSIKYIKEGLIIDFYATGATTKTTSARIKNINRTASSGYYTVTLDAPLSAAVSAGFITCQNSLNREITGLGALFDTGITTLQGVNRSGVGLLTPNTINAGGDVTDSVLIKAVRDVEIEKNAAIDTFLCGADAYDHYAMNLRELNVRVEDRTGEIEGGYKTIRLLYGNRIVDVVYDQFMPDDEIWGIDSSAVEFHTTPWDFCVDNGAPKFQLLENSSIYRGLIASYGNLVYKKPGGAVRITNASVA